MKTSTSLALICLLFLGLAGCSKPDFQTLSGSNGNFAQDKWLIVNYWATWCGPCREEIPALNDFGAARSDVKIYGVNYDNLSGEALQAAVDEMGIKFESMLIDPAPQLAIPRPRVLPTTLLIGPKGSLKASLTGPQTADSLSKAILNASTLAP
ncbi:TlpA disulfide reductase family protein [Zhongshania sp.]|jgi:thiol-disulfide isomerase/thioredoxin|uniref:TlpA family protein disulfide reductase n=1 Tax=Zhongshania sp. TaxID=1971902 RepID=UPI001B5E91FB|nr:TlpA disulfide reductase family protein [Zhongshania sp.]MBQ0794605.1 TlpA family protein disulfide reductase [Zhongshania sp.]|tara:strand:- start:5106 stop:5564 length:459 start_codon:yes stop_codon:yes gene_type:complete